MTNLLPCPFCGQTLIKNGPFGRRNADCYVHPQDLRGIDYGRCPANGFRLFSDDPEWIALWNRRAPPASPAHASEEGPGKRQNLIPEGYVLVPLEPTREMSVAGEFVLFEASQSDGTFTGDAIETYRAMLSARPDAQP